jgi:hypothetical protein
MTIVSHYGALYKEITKFVLLLQALNFMGGLPRRLVTDWLQVVPARLILDLLQVSLSLSYRSTILYITCTIVDRYDNERETWSKSRLIQAVRACCHARLMFNEFDLLLNTLI